MYHQKVFRLMKRSENETPMLYMVDPRGGKPFNPVVSVKETKAGVNAGVLYHDEDISGIYLREIAKIPLLTKEREIDLGKRMQLGEREISKLIVRCLESAKQIRQPDLRLEQNQIKQGDFIRLEERNTRDLIQSLEELLQGPGSEQNGLKDLVADLRNTEADVTAAKAEMVQSNLRLVVSIARSYVNRGLSLLDLIQEGNLGLIKAVSKYDYTKGCKFSTYACWWIVQGITRAVGNEPKIFRIPIHVLETRQKVEQATRRLVTELGRDPSPEEVSEKIGSSPNDVRKIMNLTQEPVSLETSLGEGSGRLIDLIKSQGAESFGDNLLRKMDLTKMTKALLSFLAPREQQILRLRYGIGEPKSYTLQEIGERYGVSRERVRQIEKKALNRLRLAYTQNYQGPPNQRDDSV